MVRAGVFVGVDKSGSLQQLQDAAKGAERMRDWALAQGMAKADARLITDAGGGKVTPDDISDAIAELVVSGVDQLILYFAGHGVNINRTEHWLLTEAPTKTYAAVNVTGSVELARYCGIQHVVIISDACRVAPEGIQAQSVRGVEVFPNEGPGDKSKPVDVFFACYLGRTAAELKDPKAAAGNYTALYTGALLDALKGTRPEVLEPGDAPGDLTRYVKPRKLEDYLEAEVPLRVKALGLQNKVNQDPDAIITSQATWVARIAPPAGGAPVTVPPPPPPPSPPFMPENLVNVTQNFLRLAVEQDAIPPETQLVKTGELPEGRRLVEIARRIAEPFGPDHFETQCGIKVRGAQIGDFLAPHAQPTLLSPNLLRLDNVQGPATNVLLTFNGGTGTVVPAIPGFLAALTFDDGELADVAYEPSANTGRWEFFKERVEEVRRLRAIAASSSQHGRFRLDQEDAPAIARKMQYAKGVDPTLAVYAAYAYHDQQQLSRIREMSQYMRGDLSITLFDLELLGRNLRGRRVGPKDTILPMFPLLSQGWALLKANRFELHPALNEIEGAMRESLWTLFDRAGVAQLRRLLATGEVL